MQEALPKLRITAGDLMEALRGKDIFSPADVLWGVVEPNGHISTAMMPGQEQSTPMLPLLIDNEVYKENLAALHLDEAWLEEYLSGKGLTRKQVLLLLYGEKSFLLVQKKDHPKGWSGKDSI